MTVRTRAKTRHGPPNRETQSRVEGLGSRVEVFDSCRLHKFGSLGKELSIRTCA